MLFIYIGNVQAVENDDHIKSEAFTFLYFNNNVHNKFLQKLRCDPSIPFNQIKITGN